MLLVHHTKPNIAQCDSGRHSFIFFSSDVIPGISLTFALRCSLHLRICARGLFRLSGSRQDCNRRRLETSQGKEACFPVLLRLFV